MAKLFIPILLGSSREGRRSEHAAHFVLEQAKKFDGFETELLDVRDFVKVPTTEVALPEAESKRWGEIMSRADGLIIVSPEYNHGYPGELKLMLDQLYEEYNRKPVGICGVSSGAVGGARMTQALRIVAIELQMVPMRSAVYFSNAKELFDEAGKIKEEEAYTKRLQKLFGEIVWYAEALKSARQQSK